MKIGKIQDNFKISGKVPFMNEILNSLERIEESSGEQFCKTMTGMLSGPQAEKEFNWDMTLATKAGVNLMSNNGLTCLTRMAGRVWP